MAMTLQDHVAPHLTKLRARLDKQGVASVAAMDYGTYLRSALWDAIKQWVLERDNFSCVICEKPKRGRLFEVHVHHRNYAPSTLEGREESQLVTLCERCHSRVEFYSNGEKRVSIQEKEREFQRLAALHRSIAENGLPVEIRRRKASGSASFSVQYVGPQDYREFYTLDSLMATLIFDLYAASKEKLRVPVPRRSDRGRPLASPYLIERATKKIVVKTTCSENVAEVKVSNACAYPVQRHFVKIVRKAKYWRIASPDVLSGTAARALRKRS